MELQRYLDIFKRRFWILVIVVAATVSTVAAVGLFLPPTYTAHTTLRVLLDVGMADFRLWDDYGVRLLNTHTHILRSSPILEEAISRLGSQATSLSVEGLRESVEVEVVPGTELISISVQNGNPALARDLANTLAQLLVEYAQDIYVGSSKSTLQIVQEQLDEMKSEIENDRQRLSSLIAKDNSNPEVETLTSQIEFKEDAYDRLLDRYELARLNESLRANSITVISPATLPQVPSNSFGLTHVGLSAVVGLFAGVGLALVLENLDLRIHSLQQLEHLVEPAVLGSVPRGTLSFDVLELSDKNRQISITEAYRLLSINLQALQEEVSMKTLLITSAEPNAGKSTVATNLARVYAERGQTVFLLESDLRRPTIAHMLGIDKEHSGLSHLLTERPSLTPDILSEVICPATVQESLFVISGGEKLPNPTASLASPTMEELLKYLSKQGQITFVDAPPVLGMADVSVLAPKVDGVILVVREAYSKRDQLFAALKQLETSHARVLGLIFVQRGVSDWSYE